MNENPKSKEEQIKDIDRDIQIAETNLQMWKDAQEAAKDPVNQGLRPKTPEDQKKADDRIAGKIAEHETEIGRLREKLRELQNK